MKDPESSGDADGGNREPSRELEGTTGIGPADTQSGDWLVVMYEQNWWLAKALTIDPEHQDVQVEFFFTLMGQMIVFRKNKDSAMSALCHLQIFQSS